jgi:hypothetical protein
MKRWTRVLQLFPYGHRWVRVQNEGWAFARCTRCGKERELLQERFLKSFGDKPPPLHVPGV